MQRIEKDYFIDIEDGSEIEVSERIHKILKELEQEKTDVLQSYLDAVINLTEKGEGGHNMKMDLHDSEDESGSDSDNDQSKLDQQFNKMKVKETEFDEDGF